MTAGELGPEEFTADGKSLVEISAPVGFEEIDTKLLLGLSLSLFLFRTEGMPISPLLLGLVRTRM